MRRALAAGLSVWVLTGIVLFSHMARLHPRYVESLTPAVAALLGIGVAWAAIRREPRATAGATGRLLASTVYYVERCSTAGPASGGSCSPARFGAVAFALLARTALAAATRRRRRYRRVRRARMAALERDDRDDAARGAERCR